MSLTWILSLELQRYRLTMGHPCYLGGVTGQAEIRPCRVTVLSPVVEGAVITVRGLAPAFTLSTFSYTVKGPLKLLRWHIHSSHTQGLPSPVTNLWAFINTAQKKKINKRERKGEMPRRNSPVSEVSPGGVDGPVASRREASLLLSQIIPDRS